MSQSPCGTLALKDVPSTKNTMEKWLMELSPLLSALSCRKQASALGPRIRIRDSLPLPSLAL